MSTKSERYPELDIWRGLAIVGMVIFHVFYILHFMGHIDIQYDQGLWKLLARSVQWSFLLLVGIGLQLSYQRQIAKGRSNHEFFIHMLKRILVLYGCALTVSLMSFLAVGELYIRFGILHHIATCLLLLTPLVSRPLVPLVLSVAIYLITPFITAISLPESPLLIFGIYDKHFATLDFFPLLPWMSLPSLGVFIGSLLFQKGKRRYPEQAWAKGKFFMPLAEIGKRSLFIYMIHAPIIVFLIAILSGTK